MSGADRSGKRIRVVLLLFARSADLAGTRRKEYLIDAQEQVRLTDFVEKFVLSDFEPLRPLLPACSVALNQEYTGDLNTVLSNNDEVALIPPISGG